MRDPVGAFEDARENFILYIKTAFGTRFVGLERERERLLRDSPIFCQEPWIEPLPKYEGSGKTIQDLTLDDVPGLDAAALQEFKALVSLRLVGGYQLHRHQVEMLRLALSGMNCVVTAGTGSGKTEAFLLPLIAYLILESAGWAPPGNRPAHWDDWWRSDAWQQQCFRQAGQQQRMWRSYRVPQRGHEQRPAAVRALILYPMNALVEDQLTRLRKTFDAPEVRTWFQTYRPGNRLFFGRYNSATPIPGHEWRRPPARGQTSPDSDKIEKLAEMLRGIERSANAAEQRATQTGDANMQFFFPRLDGAEMRCRWDMQDSPPDILITNYSMLSIMLMRDADRGILEKTREWLRQEGSVFHLIIDELHLYRGTAGTEVAYLLRLLMLRLGLTPSNPKLRILASSASLERDDESLSFLSQFFGAHWSAEQIIPGYPSPVPPVTGEPLLPRGPFVALAGAAPGIPAHGAACTGIAEALHMPAAAVAPEEAMRQAVEAPGAQIGARMIAACTLGQGPQQQVRAVSLGHFAAGMFGTPMPQEAHLAARGLLIARSLCDRTSCISPLPSFRLHWFFRNLEGLWACTMPGCQCAADEQGDGRTAGRLFGIGRILCREPASPHPKHRVLELLYCELCGTTFFGGSRFTLPENAGWELLNTDPDIEGIPDRQAARFVERRTYRDFAIFWPAGQCDRHADAAQWQQPVLSGQANSVQGAWRPASLHTGSARVVFGTEHPGIPEGPWVPGYIFHLPQVQDEDAQRTVSALPSVCPCCGANYRRRLYRKSPVRGFRTGFSKVSQLLSKELFYLLPPNEQRKLVVFSDSREDAASISNGIERSNYLDLVREAMFDELSNLAVGEAQLLADLQASGTPVAPEALRYAATHPAAAASQLADIQMAATPIPVGIPDVYRVQMEQARTAALGRLAAIQQRGTTRTVLLRVLFESPDPAGDPLNPGALVGLARSNATNSSRPGSNARLEKSGNQDFPERPAITGVSEFVALLLSRNTSATPQDARRQSDRE